MNPRKDIGPPQAGHRGAGGSAGGAVSMARSVKTPPLCSVISHRTASIESGAVGAEEAVVPHLLEAGGQDVLEEAAEELQRVQGHRPRPVRAHAAIREGHLAVVAGDDPTVADGDAEDIGGEVPERLPAVAGGLRVHHPVAPPHRRVDLVEQALRGGGCRGTWRGRGSTGPSTGTKKSAREAASRSRRR